MTRVFVALLCLVVLSYGLFEARRIAEGPIITITSPRDGSATSTTMLTVTGEAQNIAFLTIDNRQAYTDPAGHFSLTLSPPTGYTRITVAATDRFGRHTQKTIDITVLSYCPVHSFS